MNPDKIVDWRFRVGTIRSELHECLQEAEWLILHLRDEVSSLEIKLQVAESALEAQRPTHGT